MRQTSKKTCMDQALGAVSCPAAATVFKPVEPKLRNSFSEYPDHTVQFEVCCCDLRVDVKVPSPSKTLDWQYARSSTDSTSGVRLRTIDWASPLSYYPGSQQLDKMIRTAPGKNR